jgi:hypothetical protein
MVMSRVELTVEIGVTVRHREGEAALAIVLDKIKQLLRDYYEQERQLVTITLRSGSDIRLE